jgi:exopolyphosphatase / guanosine-5'-triphosphate,3'-diphosphate pyrophosphatase
VSDAVDGATAGQGAGREHGRTRTGEAPARDRMDGPARAGVDVGSNSVRLLVADAAGSTITRLMRITRLGAGVDETGHLDDAALERTLDALREFRAVWTDHGVDGRVRIAATSAVRDAADRERFFAGVREVTGVDAEVLSGEEEAALAHAGATGAVEVAEPAVVLDVGGGSTELVVGGPDGDVAGSVSLQLGCVRLTERLLAGDPPTPEQLAAARDEIVARLDEADARLAEQGVSLRDARSLVGVAGTSTTLGAIHLGLAEYDPTRIHGTRVPSVAVRDLAVQLAGIPAARRAGLGPVQPGREDVLHGGALIVAAVVERYGFGDLVVSESDSLDGLVASLA